jgi:hypothetical protein
MTERTTVRLPEDLLNRAKRKAAAEGRTLTSLIEDGLRLIVADNQRGTKRNRVQLRISKATGGPMPRIELTDLSAFQEIDDLDDIRRIKNFEWPPDRRSRLFIEPKVLEPPRIVDAVGHRRQPFELRPPTIGILQIEQDRAGVLLGQLAFDLPH